MQWGGGCTSKKYVLVDLRYTVLRVIICNKGSFINKYKKKLYVLVNSEDKVLREKQLTRKIARGPKDFLRRHSVATNHKLMNNLSPIMVNKRHTTNGIQCDGPRRAPSHWSCRIRSALYPRSQGRGERNQTRRQYLNHLSKSIILSGVLLKNWIS